jgi:hypothetical protein
MDLVDRNFPIDIGHPLAWLRPGAALRGCKQQDLSMKLLRNKVSRQITVLFQDLDNCVNLMLLKVREHVSLTARNVQRAGYL